MDWNKGYEARYYGTFVDPLSWRDIERFEITSGNISHTIGELRESADIGCVNYTQGEKWIRIWLDARQDGASSHTPIFTGLATSPSDSINGRLVSNTLECYSVLKPAQDVLLPRGWYASANTTGTVLIEDLLGVIPAPLEYEPNSPRLKKHIIAEDGENHLSMVEKILLAINWRLQIKGDGTVYVSPLPKKASAEYGVYDNDSIEPALTKEYDWYDCPNVFRATSDGVSVIAVDDDLNSPLSTVNRGREIWAEDTSCNLNAGETLYDYAERRLKESQQVSERVTYDRRYNPDLLTTDIVNLKYPAQNILGNYVVVSQNIELGYGGKTTEEVAR